MNRFLSWAVALVLSVGAYAQPGTPPTGEVSIENESNDGSNYYFDLYITQTSVNTDPLYLGNSDFIITFDNALFTNAALERVTDGSPGGYCTLIPENTDNGGLNDILLQFAYYNSTAVTIRNEVELTINLNGPSPDALTFSTIVAKVDNLPSTHRVGRFRITGYDGSGDPALTWKFTGPLHTKVFTFDPATQNYYPEIFPDGIQINPNSFPVELLSFEAEKINEHDVQLTWATSAELNNEKFIVEKKKNDGAFYPIAEVKGAGTTTVTQNYEYLDQSGMSNFVYYRLKQVDFDGTFEYSDVIEVTFDYRNNRQYRIYPNPASEMVNIETIRDIDQNHTFEISDVSGRLIYTGEIEAGKGISQVDITDFAEGVYLTRIKNHLGKAYLVKFVKQ